MDIRYVAKVCVRPLPPLRNKGLLMMFSIDALKKEAFIRRAEVVRFEIEC